MPDPALIRPAIAPDRDRIVALWLDLIEHHRRLDPSFPPLPGILRLLQREIRRGLRGGGCLVLVAESDAALLGFLFAEIESGGSGRPAVAGTADGFGWVHEIYVEPGARLRGVGRALLEHAAEFFSGRGQTRVAVRVESGNPAALRFWERSGFRERARILERD